MFEIVDSIVIVIHIFVIVVITARSPLSLVQAFRHQVRRLFSGDFSERPGPESPEQSVPPELLHLHDVQQAAVHRRGALHHRREQVRV